MTITPYTRIGCHGFRGSCAPNEGETRFYSSFSLGVFEWVPKKTSPGYKIGKSKVRVAGQCYNSAAVYAKAREIVALLDAGTYSGPKRVEVRRG